MDFYFIIIVFCYIYSASSVDAFKLSKRVHSAPFLIWMSHLFIVLL